MINFSDLMSDHQSAWRQKHIRQTEYGMWNGHPKPWIVPPASWEEGFWQGIRASSDNPIAQYLTDRHVSAHTDVHNLKSSWIASANLYFPFRRHAEDRAVLAKFLKEHVSPDIETVDRVELEYAEDGELNPAALLGENGGSRGKGQTSPDIAFLVNGEQGIVLTESKLTEKSFGPCSARILESKPDRPGNPDPSRCLDVAKLVAGPDGLCHQIVWGRKYWQRLEHAIDRETMAGLKACPAANIYQLFRQQAMAEGYTKKYALVVSAVAYDQRNEKLTSSLEGTGFKSYPDGWAKLFTGKARFRAWTHQAWFEWVQRHEPRRWAGWLEWIGERYAYGPGQRFPAHPSDE